MRIDLTVPYEQKDFAKAKGARWDPTRKTWYVVDPLDTKPFAMWMGKEVKDWYSGKRPKNPKKKSKKNHHASVRTGKTFTPACSCDALPWEDCEHTEALANQAMKDILS